MTARGMRGRSLLGVLPLAVWLLAAQLPAVAETENVSIPFADIGNIRNWRADGSQGIFIESSFRKWYRAGFMAPCINLRFANTIAFVTEPGGHLNRFSSILVDDERCWFRTFEALDGPPPGKDAGEE